MALGLHKINLSQFRCYEAARLDLCGPDSRPAPIIVLTGPNGSGKTNILEAVSLLVPGKGLRGAELAEMKNRGGARQDLWAISAEAETAAGLKVRAGTGLEREGKRRVVRINGRDAKSQNDLAGFLSAVWLTPQMDRLFMEGPSARRKFLDRLVFALEPDHAARLNRYEKNMRARLRLLARGGADPQWLEGLEAQMAAEAVSIAASRVSLVERLQRHAAALGRAAPLFPQPRLEMAGWAEAQIAARPALDIEDELRARLMAARGADAATGRTHEGIHRSDLLAAYAEKDTPAAQCSTGEQKALLVSIVLAHALMMQAEKGFVPLILLDEVAAHLDTERRDQLFALLRTLKGQVWLTGTDEAIFSALEGSAKFFRVGHGHAAPRPALCAPLQERA